MAYKQENLNMTAKKKKKKILRPQHCVNMDYLLFDNPSYKSCTFPLVKKTSSKILNWIKDY